MQYVLQMEVHVKRDADGKPVLPIVYSPFDLEGAVKQFEIFVGNENLLEAKIVRPLFPSFLLLCCISFIVI
jgi:hypothetical protein